MRRILDPVVILAGLVALGLGVSRVPQPLQGYIIAALLLGVPSGALLLSIANRVAAVKVAERLNPPRERHIARDPRRAPPTPMGLRVITEEARGGHDL